MSDRSIRSDDGSLPRASAQLARYLFRPVVFQEPDRVVNPPSWLEHIPFAFWIVEALRPSTFVELGTHSGNSYSAFAQAVQNLGIDTACYAVDTWQGDPQAGFYDEGVFAEWSEYHNRHFASFSRLVRATFDEAAAHFADGSVDLLHLDGWHTYASAAADFATWRPKLSRRGVVLLHDINVRERDFGAWQLWEQLKPQSPHFEFLHGHGLGVLGVGPELTEPLRWLFSQDMSSDEVHTVRQVFARLGGATSARFAAGEGAILDARERAETSRRLAEESNLRTQLETQSLAQDRIITRLRDELTARFAQTTQEAERIRQLDRQLADTNEALGRESRRLVRLQEQLQGESVRRRRVETERERLRGSARGSTTAGQSPRRRAGSWLRKRLRYLREASRFTAALGLSPGPGWPTGMRFLTDSARLREAYTIFRSGLFDAGYYRGRYVDVARSRLTPLAHFVLVGAREGRSPHPLFDAAYYLKTNPDVAAAASNPLIHYRDCGAQEGRCPHPLFDIEYYLKNNPDVREARVDPLSHFIRFGAADRRDPHPLFDTEFYLHKYVDVVDSGENPLTHFVCHGWREGRSPSATFDTKHYLAENSDVRMSGENPLVHYLLTGRSEGRTALAGHRAVPGVATDDEELPDSVEMKVRSFGPNRKERPTVLCLTHVMPIPPRAGNEYRIYRMLRWLRDQGYRLVPVVAPLPGEVVPPGALQALADEFSNAVLVDRDGRVDYILRDVPDVLASLNGEPARSASLLLDEHVARAGHERDLVQMDRVFCHDAAVTVALRLHEALGPYVLLAEYIWMSRVLPLISGDVVKVIDTIDVFSTKRAKVLQFGIDDLHVDPREETRRLEYADLVVAIQDEELRELRQLAPGKPVVTAGVDFDVVEDPGVPAGRRVLYVASANPMNRKGLLDFVRFAWPQIRLAVPDAQLVLAGRVCDALDVDVPGVVRLGVVDDLKRLYAEARVVINPAVAGTGLKIKTLEALGHLRPIVTWPSGSEGLAPELAAFCVTGKDWFEFSHGVIGLLAGDEPRVFSRAERDTIVRLTSPAVVYREITDALASMREARFGPKQAGSADRA